MKYLFLLFAFTINFGLGAQRMDSILIDQLRDSSLIVKIEIANDKKITASFQRFGADNFSKKVVILNPEGRQLKAKSARALLDRFRSYGFQSTLIGVQESPWSFLYKYILQR